MAVLLDVDGLLDFTLVPHLFSAEYPDVLLGHRVSSGQTVFTHSSRFVQVQVFFEPDPEGPLGLPDVRVVRVVITGDVIYCSTFVLQGSLVFGVYNFGAQCVGRFVVHVDVFRLVDSSKLFGETCYVGYSQHRASGVGAAGSRSVLCSGLAGPGDL